MSDYDYEKRRVAAMHHSGARYAAERVRELLDAQPGLIGEEVFARLGEEADEALAEVERWDALRDS